MGYFNGSDPQDYVTYGISLFTGFLDGSFKAANTSACRSSLKKITGSFANMTLAVKDDDQNETVWYSTRVLKYFHPSLFHCYFAGKETYLSFESYIFNASLKDILYNLIYKTGLFMDQLRIIYYLVFFESPLDDREVYVIARSFGALFNILLEPDSPRPVYSQMNFV
jgi:hypothetical protein